MTSDRNEGADKGGGDGESSRWARCVSVTLHQCVVSGVDDIRDERGGIGRLAKSILTAALSCWINHDMHASTQGPCREGDILTLMESEREARRLR